jgi:hypothetical protein
MNGPANLRALVVAAAAGLALGALGYAVTRGNDTPPSPSTPSSAAPLLPSALPTVTAPAPRASGTLPPEAAAETGGSYYAAFLAVAQDAGDPALTAAQQRAQALGYLGGVGDIDCTPGARAQLRLPARGTYTAYSVFFASQQRAREFVSAYGGHVVGIARITASCLD